MNKGSTVFALSTPVGGAITVIRISGPDSRRVLSSVFTGSIADRRVSYGAVAAPGGDTVDRAMAVWFAAPRSYTGEDMAEIYCHGSYAVAKEVTELLLSTGLCSPAEPGEFTKRAYLNGKMDLAQAEAVMDLVASTAERSRKAALKQLEGGLSTVVSGLYERLRLLCAELANMMDDETGEAVLDPDGFASKLKELSKETEALCRDGLRSRILREGARIALIGSPNVGKSSLLNALLLRDRAIVTPVPGTTRDTVEESISIEGIPAVLIDTAGIRESKDEVEAAGIERSIREAEDADLVLWLADGSRALEEADRETVSGLDGGKIIAVITKADAENVIFPEADGTFCGFPALRTSAVTGEGLSELKRLIAEKLLPESGDQTPFLTNSRHISLLLEAKARIDAASELIPGDTDAAYFELREAMELVSGVTGTEDVSEDIIDSIFKNFCLGK